MNLQGVSHRLRLCHASNLSCKFFLCSTTGSVQMAHWYESGNRTNGRSAYSCANLRLGEKKEKRVNPGNPRLSDPSHQLPVSLALIQHGVHAASSSRPRGNGASLALIQHRAHASRPRGSGSAVTSHCIGPRRLLRRPIEFL